jgi:hypothetical protein
MILALFVATVTIVAASAAVGGQEAAPARRPAFEAATIKVATAAANPFLIMQAAPNRLHIQSQTLAQLIFTAYGNGGFNTEMSVKGGPEWAGRTSVAPAAGRRVDRQDRPHRPLHDGTRVHVSQ